jgi:hypothetical protein
MAATDIVKLVVAAAMVVAGIAGYYMLAANSIVLRLWRSSPASSRASRGLDERAGPGVPRVRA